MMKLLTPLKFQMNLLGVVNSLLELGNSLSFIMRHSAEVHVCILKDLRCNEWAKLYKIREAIDGLNFLCESFIPVGWLDDGQILVFIDFEKLVVTYNVKTGEARSFNVFSSDFIRKHTNSLVSWKHLVGKDRRGVSSTWQKLSCNIWSLNSISLHDARVYKRLCIPTWG